jgi:uncharacterized membrane protein YcaP (DUF421 family)
MFWKQITKFDYVRNFTIGYYVIRPIYATTLARIIYQVRIFLLLPVTMVGHESKARENVELYYFRLHSVI